MCSDTSGETIPSDSGRGSLDDDHHNMSKSHQSGKYFWLVGWFLVFNATFNNISVISQRSVLLVELTGVPASH
jgi:hypothetical protein